MPKLRLALLLSVFAFFFFLTAESFGGDEIVKLSLSECLNIGLANNLDIKIARLESKIAREEIMLSEAVFDTLLTGGASYTDDQLAQSTSILGEKTLTNEYKISGAKKLLTGTEISVDWSDTRTWTDSIFAVNNPTHTAELSFSATQPILNNFFGYADRATVKLTEIDVENTDLTVLSDIEDAVAEIEKTYWELAFAHKNVALKKGMLKKAEELYKTNEEHLKIGIVETTALYGAESNMRKRKTELVLAENDLQDVNNKLKLLLNETGNFLILPKDGLMPPGKKADLVRALKEALVSRRDYKEKMNDLEARDITLKMKDNALWPEVDLVGTLAVNGVHRKFSKANRRLTTNKSPMFYGGIEVALSLDNRKAQAEFNQAALEKEKAILEMQKLEKEVINEVDEEVRAVNVNQENAHRRIKIREIETLKLAEEEKSFKHGRSSTKTIIDYQDDLSIAELNEHSALLAYYSSLIDLENTKDKLLERAGVIE